MKPLAEMGRYATVVIDPPWPLKPTGLKGSGTSIPLTYDTMTISEISDIPVSVVLDTDAIVFCWTVNKFLPCTFEIIKTWGLRYSFTMTWIKNGGIQTPLSPKFNSEWIIVGKKGTPTFTDIKSFFTANSWNRGGHSTKPEGFYDLLRRVTPAPRLDIFGRRLIGGFDSWGNEAPEGTAPPDSHQQVLIL